MVRRILSAFVTYSIEFAALAIVVSAIVIGCRSLSGGGVIRQHYENGSLWRETHVDRDGKMHGRFLELYEDGSIKTETDYSHGSWIHSRHYHRNGQLAQESDGVQTRDWLDDGTEVTPRVR